MKNALFRSIPNRLKGGFLSILVAVSCQMGSGAEMVIETSREIPLAYDVDVVVAGGSLAGVEAACAAAEHGASVLLVDSRPYIGYDLCAFQKLWLDENDVLETALTKALFDSKRVVTPIDAKRVLDQALLKHNVQFLTGSYPAELLVGEDETPGGLTIVNRSGRQAVRAKVVIDATANAVLARQSAAQFAPFKPGTKEFTFTVVGGALKNEQHGKQVPDVLFESTLWQKKKKTSVTNRYPVYEYAFPVEYEADTFRERSKVLNRIRSMVYDPKMVDQAEHLLHTPDHVVSGGTRPRGIDNLYVLNAYSGERRSPIEFARIGRQVGIEAAEQSKKRGVPAELKYGGTPYAKREMAVAEVAPSFRFRDCPQLELGSHDLPILGQWDVVVVGGGTSGAPAAIGASRSGAETLVIEYMDELGGVGTAGLISIYWYGFETGFTAEMDQALDVADHKWNPIQKAEWLRSELMKNGAEVWFGGFGCGTVMQGNKVAGVVVATPFGRGVVLADTVIDSTGNADIAAAAGADTHYSISAHGDLTVQVAGYPDRGLGRHANNTAYAMINDSDVLDRTHFLMTARQRMAMNNKAYDMGQLIDSRDRRRIVGDYVLTTQDILTARTFPDTISHHRSNFDAGALPDDPMFMIKDMKGPVYECDMPFRCLTPKGIEGLLVTGLGTSAHRDAMTLTRMQPDLQNQGYAAGVAAAMAAEQTGGLVRQIDLKELQRAMVDKGCLEERALSDQDSFPIPQKALRKDVQTLEHLTIDVHQKPKHDDSLTALGFVMGNPEQSIPLLREAYRKAERPRVKINYARILAVMGDATGKDTLLRAVEDAKDWGEGWDFSNQRKYANTFGEVDRLVIALGFLRTPEAHPPLLRKLGALTAESPLSHYKAVCLALRLNQDKSLAKPLARLLNKKGVSGHAQPLGYYGADKGKLQPRHRVDKEGGDALNAKFKELLVAALLFECGDHNGQGREALEAYTKDVNGHFAAYAYDVLTQGAAMKGKPEAMERPSLPKGYDVARKPNIIVIMADDMGFSDLGCYGGEIQTPNIDQLAREGVRFTGFKNTSRCTPSRASLLTGRYAHSVGVGHMSQDRNMPGYRGQLSTEAPTMAEILKPHGYGTGIVGKWHLTVTSKKTDQEQLFPLDRGFDFFHGTWWGAKNYFSPEYMMKNREHLEEGNYPDDYYLTEDLSDSAIEFVQSQMDQKRPFYLYLAHYAPHAPIQAPADRVQKCFDRYMAGFEKLQRERFARQQTLGVLPENATIAAGMPSWGKLSDSEKKTWATLMATYAAMIEIMDDGIGRLVETLKKNGQYDNTLILVLSDNGSTPERKGSTTYPMLSNTPYRSFKAHAFEGGVSSPLIVSWPSELSERAGSVRHGPCHIIDILPTCLDAAGVEFPSAFRGGKPVGPDGGSLMAAVKGAELPERPLFWEHQGSRAVYQDGWKLVADGVTEPWELYNLPDDPTEQKDQSKKFSERADALKHLWETWAQKNNVLPLRGKGAK